jgi:hypothetical protein
LTGPKGDRGLTGAAGSTASITTGTTLTPGQVRLGGSTNSRLDDEGSWGFRSRTNSGYIQFGPANTSHAHIYTDRANFYFNKELRVNGAVVYTSGNLNTGVFARKDVDSIFGDGKLRATHVMYLRHPSRKDWQSYISSDGNGFTRIAGQYGVGFLGNGATAGGELGRFTAVGTDLTKSAKLNVGTEREMARIDICNGSSIFQQKNTHGDNLYISCLARYQHKPAQGWFMTEKGQACVLAVARNGLHMHSTNELHNKGAKIKAYSHDMMMNHNGHMYVRGGYHKLSDVREKKNIKTLDRIDSLDRVLKLNAVSFNWKDRADDQETKLGLIAQEVEQLVPSSVSETGENKMAGGQVFPSRKSVDYESLVPLLISAIQNQQQQINQLRKQLNSK